MVVDEIKPSHGLVRGLDARPPDMHIAHVALGAQAQPTIDAACRSQCAVIKRGPGHVTPRDVPDDHGREHIAEIHAVGPPEELDRIRLEISAWTLAQSAQQLGAAIGDLVLQCQGQVVHGLARFKQVKGQLDCSRIHVEVIKSVFGDISL